MRNKHKGKEVRMRKAGKNRTLEVLEEKKKWDKKKSYKDQSLF